MPKRKKSVGSVKVVSPAGKPGMFTAGQMRDWKFVSYLATDRLSVAKGLGLPASAVDEDFSLDGQLRPVRIAVKGPITAALTDQWQNIIQNQVRDADVNLICLWIDSPGGSPTDSVNFANFLVGLDSTQRRTVAYIPSQAGRRLLHRSGVRPYRDASRSDHGRLRGFRDSRRSNPADGQ